MSRSALAAGVRYLRQVVASQCHPKDSDERLLHAFVMSRDETAFAALVRRYGSMVGGVCRRVLGHQQDAEDAFQATFLVLAQNAARLRKKTALASFLHGTAYRISLNAKRTAARRRKHEGQAPARPFLDPIDELSWREVRALVDEEVARLPEKYRSAFILCCLEGVSQEEAAQRLGLKEGTVSSRLTRARKQLAKQLSRRGVELAAVLTAMGLATHSASALPVGLMATTIETALRAASGEKLTGIVSASVALLVKDMAQAMMLSKMKLAATIVLAAMLGGAGLWYSAKPQAAAEPPNTPAQPPAHARIRSARESQKPVGSLILRGRVLGPDNKPVAGAKLYLPHWSRDRQQKHGDVAVVQRGNTDKDGRFRLELPRTEIQPDQDFSLLAAADGFGLAWVGLPQKEAVGELTLWLVNDVPIRGRLLTTEGKPIAGVTVTVAGILAFERLDDFLRAFQRDMRHAVEEMGARRLLLPLNSVLRVKPTDKDGRFEITGIGVERIAGLEMNSAAGIEDVMLAVTREGFDAKSYLKGLLREPRDGPPPAFFGPSFEHIVQRDEANQVIEGTVREARSGKPVSGVTITTGPAMAATDSSLAGVALVLGRKLSEANVGVITAVTDERGHYRLAAKRKQPNYWLEIRAAGDLPLIGFGLVVNASAVSARGPIRADVEMRRGGVVTGRVYDKATGKGVPSKVRFEPLPENKSDGLEFYKKRNDLWAETGADGRFRLVTIPGPGVLTARISDTLRKIDGVWIDPYKQAKLDAADRPRIKMNDPSDPHRGVLTAAGVLYLESFHACKVLDAKEGSAIFCDLALNPVNTLTVQLQDAEGKPLSGAAAIGVSDQTKNMVPLQSATCKIYALDPTKPRQVAFLHAERKLAALVKLRGDEKESMTVRLALGGVLTGRALDEEGHPVAGAEVLVFYAMSESHYKMGFLLGDLLPRTDKEGRFRLEGIVPGLKVNLFFLKGKQNFSPPRPLNIKPLQSGNSVDVGDIRTKRRGP
jgi:RNA polymerase sigma factor (sigma-70 family)